MRERGIRAGAWRGKGGLRTEGRQVPRREEGRQEEPPEGK